jgi:hypothetical protein
MNKFFALAVLIISAELWGQSTVPESSAEPVFVGRAAHFVFHAPPMRRSLSLTYMTADEMQSKVVSLTGFLHPAFDAYADVLGRYDSRTGLRTNDRPSLISVFFMQNITMAIADSVVEREIFLDDSERIVFSGADLLTSPDDSKLTTAIDGLFVRWLGSSASPEALVQLQIGFRRTEAANNVPAAYKWLLSMLLRHGGLYYY